MIADPTDDLRGSGDDPFALTPEQHRIVALLERLLGRAIANRYVDFSWLDSSGTGLRASRPMAAHALRELDSILFNDLRASEIGDIASC